MVLRVFAIIGLIVLLVLWTAEARNSRSLKRSSRAETPSRDGEQGQDEESYPRFRRHRYPSRHPSPSSSRRASRSSHEFADPRTASDNIDYENEEIASREDEEVNRQLSRHKILDRLRLKGRKAAQYQHPFHHRRSSKFRSFSNENSASVLELVSDVNSREHKLAEALWNHARGKRHNGRRTWTAEDLKSFNDSRLKLAQFESESAYEVEVREAQNSSLCNYTVISIPDPGGRIPRELEHIKCNHAGSRCQDTGTYCCIQTYRNVEVMYVNGKKEMMKVYSGCVCALQSYGTLEPYAPDVNIND